MQKGQRQPRVVPPDHQLCQIEEKCGKHATIAVEGIMTTDNDWLMREDLSMQLNFPQHIAISNLRPNIVLWSQPKRTVLLMELTVLHEDQINKAQERKRLKYQYLVEQYHDK